MGTLAFLALQGRREANDRFQEARAARISEEKQKIAAQRSEQAAKTSAELARQNETKAKAATVVATAAEQKARAEKDRADARTREALAATQQAQTATRQERDAKQKEAHLLNVANMQLAGRAWDSGDARTVTQILATNRPAPGQKDQRGFEWGYQWNLLHNGGTPVWRHPGPVVHAGFDADGALVTDSLRQIRRWDPKKRGVQLTDLSLLPGIAISHALSQDGHRAAVGMEDGTVWLRDLAAGGGKRALRGHTRFVFGCVFTPDGSHLLSVGNDGTGRIWNTATGQARIVKMKVPDCNQLALSPDARWLAVAGPGGLKEVRLLDMKAGVTSVNTMRLNGHTSTTRSVAFSPDGKLLASGDSAGDVILWDVASQQNIRSLKGHTAFLQQLAFSPNGERLASGSADGRVKIWDVETGQFQRAFKAHTREITSLCFSGKGDTLFTGCDDGAARLWQLASPPDALDLHGHTDRVAGLAFSPDSATLASGSRDQSIRLWDARTGLEKRHIKTEKQVVRVAFSPDGRVLASGGDGLQVQLWGASTGKLLRTLRPTPDRLRPDLPISGVAFSPDGRFLAAGGGKPTNYAETDILATIIVWDTRTWRPVAELKGHRRYITEIAFSPDSTMLASASQDRTVKLWSVKSWSEIRSLGGFRERVGCVAFSSDGSALAAGDWGADIRRWRTVDWQEMPTLKGHVNAVTGLAFMPDGKTLASASWDRTVKLWDLESQRETRTLQGGNEWAAVVARSPDGQTLAAVGENFSIKLWRAVPTARADEADRREAATLREAAQLRSRLLARSAAHDRAVFKHAIPARNPYTASAQIDLSHVYNARLNEDFHDRWRILPLDLSGLPSGLQMVAGTRFDIRGVVQTAMPESTDRRSFPAAVTIPIRQTCARLVFLHACGGGIVPGGTEIGAYRIHYSDGQTVRLPIVYGKDVRDWGTSGDAKTMPNVAWTGHSPAARKGFSACRLFKTCWSNPRLGVRVEHLEFVSGRQLAAPFLVALTAEDTAAAREAMRVETESYRRQTLAAQQAVRQIEQEIREHRLPDVALLQMPPSPLKPPGNTDWKLVKSDKAEGTPDFPKDGSMQINITQGGDGLWSAVLTQSDINFDPERRYILQFRARADRENLILGVNIAKTNPPISFSDMLDHVVLGKEWRYFRYLVDTSEVMPGLRHILFACGQEKGRVWIADVLLVPDPADK
jgi:WD40 repeat protein